jgi:hypothetical protein
MTIGISAVCSYKNPGDCIVLASDRLGSFGTAFSTRKLAKMFIQGEQDAVFAGFLSRQVFKRPGINHMPPTCRVTDRNSCGD